MTRKEKIRKLRALGYTFPTIAQKCGCSVGTAQKACSAMPRKFKPITPERCVYKNLRTWMNIHEVTVSDLSRRIDGTGNAVSNLCRILTGKQNPTKKTVEKMMQVTGLAYEVLFEVDANEDQ